MNLKKTAKSIRNFFIKHWKKWTIFSFLAILVYIGFIFYEYVYKPIYALKEVAPFKLEIKRAVYQGIVDAYLNKGEKVNQINTKNYLDPFK